MEILFFINGILFLGMIGGILLLRQMNISNKDLEKQIQDQINSSYINNGNLWDELTYIKNLVLDIQFNMEKDQYENLSNLKKGMEILQSDTKKDRERINFLYTNSDKINGSVFSEIQQLKQNIKSISQNYN